MLDSDLLVVWMPTRVHPRTVLDQARKYGLSISVGCGEPEVRACWQDVPGAYFSVIDWQGEWQAGRLAPPESIRDFLETVAVSEPHGFELIFWREPPDLDAPRTVLGLGHADFEAGVRLRILP